MTNINDLTIGISQALEKNVQNTTIYVEKIKQDFKEPCFFIKVLTSSQDKDLNVRYKKHIVYDIHYFSDQKNLNTDCNNMTDKLYEILEYINVDGSLYRANKMTHEIVDDVLHFNISFDYRVIKEVEKPAKMQKLKVGVKSNG